MLWQASVAEFKIRFQRAYAAALTAVIGPIIPPSIPMITWRALWPRLMRW